MKNYERYNKFLILENDIEEKGLPNILKQVVKDHPNIRSEVWWWFNQDMRQNQVECFKKFSKLKNETFILTYPSFIGWDRSFEEQLYVFDELAETNIKLRIGVIHEDFYWYIINWLHGNKFNKTRMNSHIRRLKHILKFHEIYYVKTEDINYKHVNIFEKLERLTWSSLEENYFVDTLQVRIKTSKEIRKIAFVSINLGGPEKSIIALRRSNNEMRNDFFKLTEIEKI